MQIILPPEVQYRMELEEGLERLGRLRERAGWLKEFDAHLKQIDHRLSLVKATENSTQAGLVPGFWHVQRLNDVTMPSYLPITMPDGSFSEPTSWHLEQLRKSDLQRPGALDELRKRQEREAAQRERDKALLRGDRVEELLGRVKAIESPGVSMAPGWTYRKSGRRGRAA